MMNKTNRSKTVALFLALALAASALSGCGGAEGGSGVNPADSSAGTSGTAAGAPSGGTDQSETVKIELVCGDNIVLPELEDNFINQALNEALNLDITLNVIGAGADYTTALNTRVTGGDAPDLFVAPNKDAMKQYADNGVIMSLSPYLDKLQPVVEWIGGEEGLKSNIYNGEIYYVPKRGQLSYNTWIARQDWMDKVDASIPTTVDEALEVARKLTFEDPDGNGKNDTYGFSGMGLFAFNAILNPYDVSVSNLITVEDGKVISSLLKPGMKDGLEMCKNWVDEGVVDPDIVANNESSARDKIVQGQIGMLPYNWAALYKKLYMDQVKEVNPNADWIWFDPLQSEVGAAAYYESVSVANTMGKWVVNAKIGEDPVKINRVCDLLNYMVSEEGQRLLSYGIEGRHYNLEGDTVVPTELMAKECDFLWSYQICFRDDLPYLQTKFPEAKEVIEFTYYMERAASFNSAVDTPDGFHKEDLDKYIQDNMIAFIFGQRPISEYDTFIGELKTSFGFDQYMAAAEEQLKEKGYL